MILEVVTQTTVQNQHAYAADGAEVSAVAVHFLGHSSGSFSSLKNISKWPLKQIGSNLSLYAWLVQQVSKHFALDKALAAPAVDQRKFTFMTAQDTQAHLQEEITRRVNNLLPILNKHRHLASTLANRWAKFLTGLESSYGLENNKKLKNFLLAFYDAQRLHLDTLPDIAIMNDIIKANARSQLKSGNRTLLFAHVQESILSGNISRHKEDLSVAYGHRSPLYQSFSTSGKFPMQQPHEVDLCVPPNVNPSCNETAIPTGPPATPEMVNPIHHKMISEAQDLMGFHKFLNTLGNDLDKSKQATNDLQQYLRTMGNTRKKRGTTNHATSRPDHATPFVVDVKPSICFWHWCLQTGAHQKWKRTADHQVRKIKKRFVLMAVLAVASLISLLSSVAVGAYSASEINYIHKSLASTDTAVSALVHSMDIMDSNVHLLDNKTDHLGRQLVDLCKVVDMVNFEKTVLTLDATLTDYYNSISSHVLDHELAFSDLRRGSFPYMLASFSSLERLYAELKLRARQIGQELLLDSPTSIFQTQTTLFFVDQNPFLLSNVPTMSEASQTLDILRLSLDPVLLSNTSLTYSSDYPVVITNKDRTFFQELTNEEFDKCKHLSHTGKDFYFCQYKNGVFSKDIQSSCVMSLLHSDPASSKACRVSIGHLSDYVKQIDHDTFLLYSTKADHLTVSCPRDGHRKMVPFTGFQRIQLEPGCMADTISHRIYRGLDEVHHRSLTTITRPINVQNLFSSLTSDVPKALSIIQGHLNKLMAEDHPRSINLNDAHKAIAAALAHENLWNRFQEHKFEILMGVSGFALTLTLLYFTVRFVIYRRRRQALQRELAQEQELQDQEPEIIRPVPRPARDLRRALLAPGYRP